MELVVHESPDETANAAAARIAEILAAAGENPTLGLAGGSTPAATYRILRGLDVDWEPVDVWLSDERWVPHDHERSNGRMASEALMDHVAAKFWRPNWNEAFEPSDSAAHYEAKIRSIHGDKRPNLILLGMGDDAHTASLFPGSAALDEAARWFVANVIPETGEPRLTATYPLLWRAERLMVITTGEKKAAALKESFETRSTPIGRIGEGEAEVEWFVDRAAASLLS